MEELKADFIDFCEFEKYHQKFYKNNEKIIEAFRDSYFNTNPLMDNISFNIKLKKNMHICNQNFEKEQKWIISIEEPSEDDPVFGISSIYVFPLYRNKGLGSEALFLLQKIATQLNMALPFIFAVHEDNYTDKLANFYEKNNCISLHIKEKDPLGIGWYRFVWAIFDFDLVFDEKLQKSLIKANAESLKKIIPIND